jgi:hypothetical protein
MVPIAFQQNKYVIAIMADDLKSLYFETGISLYLACAYVQ